MQGDNMTQLKLKRNKRYIRSVFLQALPTWLICLVGVIWISQFSWTVFLILIFMPIIMFSFSYWASTIPITLALTDKYLQFGQQIYYTENVEKLVLREKKRYTLVYLKLIGKKRLKFFLQLDGFTTDPDDILHDLKRYVIVETETT